MNINWAKFGKLKKHLSFNSTIIKVVELLAVRPSQMIVISDFDHTLTTFCSLQCHDIVGSHSEYSDEFCHAFNNTFIDFGEKVSLSELWKISHDLIVNKSGLTNLMFRQHFSENVPSLRPGLQFLIKALKENEIPLLILSAGIKNVIVETLLAHGIDISHQEKLLHIDSNNMIFNEYGHVTAILPNEPIHSRNKHLAPQRLPTVFYDDEHKIMGNGEYSFSVPITTNNDFVVEATSILSENNELLCSIVK